MADVPFTHYLHDDKEQWNLRQTISDALGREVDDEFMDRVGRPFYEVALDCTVDDETGEVRIVSARN